jgi:hypothetical protein
VGKKGKTDLVLGFVGGRGRKNTESTAQKQWKQSISRNDATAGQRPGQHNLELLPCGIEAAQIISRTLACRKIIANGNPMDELP